MNEIITIFLSMIPLSEFKGAMPFAMLVFRFSSLKAALLSAIGNVLIVLPLLFVWYKLGDYLENRFSVFKRIFSYTHNKHKKHFETWETLALFTFVALPLPGTGVWTASIAARIFNFSFKRAAASIIAGTIVSVSIYYVFVFILDLAI